MTTTRQKRPTLGPSECAHCHTIWYGTFVYGEEGASIAIPDDVVLCVKCWAALDRFLYRRSPSVYNAISDREAARAVSGFYEAARTWIADETKAPRPRKRRYQQSVPTWMRKAIDRGLVKPNSEDIYTVLTTGDEPVSVETGRDR
jgi:hypothetical protein